MLSSLRPDVEQSPPGCSVVTALLFESLDKEAKHPHLEEKVALSDAPTAPLGDVPLVIRSD